MRQLGIIATAEERISPDPKWYWFWRRRACFELVGLEDSELELTVSYLPSKKRQYSKWLKNTKELFLRRGIYNVVYTKKAHQQEDLQCEDIMIHQGHELTIALLPQIIAKIAKTKNIELQKATLVYVDDALLAHADHLLHSLSRMCRYLILMTKNKGKATDIAEVLFEEYGIPIELYFDGLQKIQCDFLIRMDGYMPKTSKNTIIIDMQKENQPSRISVDTIDLTVPESITKAMPFTFHSKDILQALWKIGMIKQTDLSRAKIKKIYYHFHE